MPDHPENEQVARWIGGLKTWLASEAGGAARY